MYWADSGVGRASGLKASGCAGDDVGREKASCVELMAAPFLRWELDENKSVNQPMVTEGRRRILPKLIKQNQNYLN